MPYLAKQRIGFGQLTWDKEINNHDLLFWDCPPLPILRWQHYRNSKEDINWIPSLFVQDEITLTENIKFFLVHD
jgi:outer membrane receptor for ferrienterochelin and colicins